VRDLRPLALADGETLSEFVEASVRASVDRQRDIIVNKRMASLRMSLVASSIVKAPAGRPRRLAGDGGDLSTRPGAGLRPGLLVGAEPTTLLSKV
jgi:hypothetical protein